MEKNEIIIDGKEYVLKTSINNKLATKNKKGLTYCIVRTYSAGVWAGWIDTKDKSMCQEVYEARRLHHWWSEFTLSALAVEGQKVGKENQNKYAIPVEKVILKEIIEVIPCTEKSKKQIIETPNYRE
jgi:hypothetical protein